MTAEQAMRKPFVHAALALLGAGTGCSSPPSGHTVQARGQAQAIATLERATGDRWRSIRDRSTKQMKHLDAARTGDARLAPGADAARTTLAFLAEHKDLLQMREPTKELALVKSEVDELGMTHARFHQDVHGLAVVGAEVMTHYDRHGRVTSIDASYVPHLDADLLDLEPAISASTVVRTIESGVLAQTPDIDRSKVHSAPPELVVYAARGRLARLAWRVRVRAVTGRAPAIWVSTTDAKTGEVLDLYDDLQTVTGSGLGVLGDKKKLEVVPVSGGFAMSTTIGGVAIRTRTAENEDNLPGSIVTSRSHTSWDTDVAGAGSAVDAHANAASVLEYYKTKHQRNALDGQGGALESTVHFGADFENAFWDGQSMTYGDGGQEMRSLAAALDIVAHEFSHGVTSSTSGLQYTGESGALNEAFSDIISAFVEHHVTPHPKNNWLLGEAVTLDAPANRDMKNPNSIDDQPAHMKQFVETQQDNGGVHINSGIINNAAYLMTMGGVNNVSKVVVKFGIGWEKSEKLWYRANTRYFMETTDFEQAAEDVLQAATDIALTENERNIVECAFKAVGIVSGKCAPIVDPSPSREPGETDLEPNAEDEGEAPDDASGREGRKRAREGEDEDTTESSAARAATPNGTAGCQAGAGLTNGPSLAHLCGALLAFLALRRGRRSE
jgi:bacillolysin